MCASRNLKPDTQERWGLLSGLETMNVWAVISRQVFVKITNLRNGENICDARSGYPIAERTFHNLRQRLLRLDSMAHINPSLFCPAQAKWCAEDEEKSNTPPWILILYVTTEMGRGWRSFLPVTWISENSVCSGRRTLQHPALPGMDLNFRLPRAEPFINEHPLITLQGGWHLDKCISQLSQKSASPVTAETRSCRELSPCLTLSTFVFCSN